MTPKGLSKDDRVLVSGLVKAVHLNGKHGTVVLVPKQTKAGEDIQYGIHVDGEEKPMAIKLSNLSLAVPLFQIGDHVVVHSLTMNKKHNGLLGRIITDPNPSTEGRYGVRMVMSKKLLSIKSSNMQLPVKKTKDLERARNKMREETSLTREEAAGADDMALIRLIRNTFLDEEKQIQVFGRRIEVVPDFIAELKRDGGLPLGVDGRWALDYLRMSYEHASSLPHMFEISLKSPSYAPHTKEIVRRLGTNDPEKLRWYRSGRQPGDIYTNGQDHPYTGVVRHNYSNQAYRTEMLHQGTTHVAVGFVDLGILMAADIRPGSTRKGNQLRFVGVERSAFCVAKTHVVWELIRESARAPAGNSSGLIDSIVQVWYSSTWTSDTEVAVKKALDVLCRSDKAYNVDVRKTLEHWKSAKTMSLENARNAHKSKTSDGRSEIGTMKLMIDRLAMARYELTGDFAVNTGPSCGSIIMFDCPDFTPPCALDESVFCALSFVRIMEIANQSSPPISIVDAAEEYARRGVKKLVSWCQTGKLEVELVCSRFESAIDYIASLRPWTMSWSNVLDYLQHGHFHGLARRCSKHGDTLHFGYSMNWSTNVWGTCLIDYSGEEFVNLRTKILAGTNDVVVKSYNNLGWDKRICLPLRDNPTNTTKIVLEVESYRGWCDYFFGQGRKGGMPCRVGNFEHVIPSPLAVTGGNTVSFTWTYDPDINFHPIHSFP